MAILLASLTNPHPYELLQRIAQANTYPTSDWYSIIWWIQNIPFPSVPKFIIYIVILVYWFASHRYVDKEYWFSTRQIFSLMIFYLAFAHYRMGWLLCFPMMDAAQNLKSKIIKSNQPLNINAVLVIYITILLCPPPLPEDQLYNLPVSSIQYIQQNGMEGNVYCPWTWSGYVTWKTDKKCQVFLDTRIEPFDRELIELHFNAFANPIPYFEHIKVRNTKYILYPSDLAYEKMIYLSKVGKMTILYEDNTSFLAEVKQ